MEESNNKFDSVYSNKVRAGSRRTYFFDVRPTKSEDYFICMTESTRRSDGKGYDRHKIFLYKEDFHKFIDNLQDTIDYVKENLIQDFDYDSFSNDYDDNYNDNQNDNDSSGGNSDNSDQLNSEEDMEW